MRLSSIALLPASLLAAVLAFCGPTSESHAAAPDSAVGQADQAAASDAAASHALKTQPAAGVDLFQAMKDGAVEVKFIAKNDHQARVIIANKLDEEIQLVLPEAFAGVPAAVFAQRGGGGGGFGGGGGGMGGGGFGGGGGGGNQSVGGGMGGMGGGGMGGMGGGGGMFSIPAEKTAKIDAEVVCLDHGKKDPSSSNEYVMVPAAEHIERPAVIEMIKALGRGQLQHNAAQAAVWHLNNDLTWQQLASKQQGTARSLVRPPYFSQMELRAAMAYSQEAGRLAAMNASEYERSMSPAQSLSDEPSAEYIESDGVDEANPESADAADAEAVQDNSASEEPAQVIAPAEAS